MENNVIELRYDKVNGYFAKFKNKYADNYEKNKIKGTRIVKDYNSLILSLIFMIGCVVVFLLDSNLPNNNISATRLIDVHRLLITWILPAIAIVSLALLMRTLVDFMRGGHEVQIEYTKKEYYTTIKSTMLNDLRMTLNNQITEAMLIFDKNGLVIGPNLNSNENKKIFSEAERRLITSGKQFSRT